MLTNRLIKRNIPIKLYLGEEILTYYENVDNNIYNLKNNIYSSMNKTKYILIEFDTYENSLHEIKYCIDKYMVNGYIPIIAHAERYRMLSVDDIKQLKKCGALIQINLFSVSNELNKQTKNKTKNLLINYLVDFTGSDCHRLNHRPPIIADGINSLYYDYDNNYIDNILFNNAKEMLIYES